jgi:hypothetical protein
MSDEEPKTRAPKQYVVNLKQRAGYPRLSNIAGVQYAPVLKKIGTLHVEGLGDIDKMTTTLSRDINTLQVNFTDSFGLVTIKKDRGAIHQRVRRLRQQEAQRIADLDEEIRALRLQRDSLVRLAWKNGNTVTIKELEAMVKK